MELREITPKRLEEVDDQELLMLHLRTHQLFGGYPENGVNIEDVVNAHHLIVREMKRRGMNHRKRSELDVALKNWIEEALGESGDLILVPSYISLVGSATEKENPEDIDLLVREDPERLSEGQKESLYLLMRRVFDPQKSGKEIHLLFNAQGPHIHEGKGQEYIPLFDLVLRPREKAESVSAEIAKAEELRPIAQYTLQKPFMAGYTEFFSADELWEKWASRQDVELYISPKVDGFRSVIQKAGDKFSIYFEDTKQERSDDLPELVEALKDLPDCIIEGELQYALGERFLARPQVLSALAGKIPGAVPYVFLYDILYYDDRDIHRLPFRERLTYLEEISGEPFIVLPQKIVRTKEELEREAKKMLSWQPWEDAGLAIEGIVVRRADMPYTFGVTDDYAKFKLWVELKVKVLRVNKVENGYTYECALRDGDTDVPIGKTFVSKEKLAEAGDTLNVMVEELIVEDGKVSWGKPTPLGPDRSRPAYTVAQAIDIARRGRVLKEVISKASKVEAVLLGTGAMNSPRIDASLLIRIGDMGILFDAGPDISPELIRKHVDGLHAVFVCDGKDEYARYARRIARRFGAQYFAPSRRQSFEIAGVRIQSRRVAHTNRPTFGYLIFTEKTTIAWAPEFYEVPGWLRNVDLAFIEAAAYDRPIEFAGGIGGHAAVLDTLEKLKGRNISEIVLAHIGKPTERAIEEGWRPENAVIGADGMKWDLL